MHEKISNELVRYDKVLKLKKKILNKNRNVSEQHE